MAKSVLKRSYLKSMIDCYICDYTIDTFKDGQKLLHNIMKLKYVNDRFEVPALDQFPVYYKLTEKISSIVWLNKTSDLCESWIRDLWIQHVLNFIEVNDKHIFIICTKYPDRLLNFELPDNILYCTIVSGTDSEDIDRMASLQVISKDFGLKTGIFYMLPKSELITPETDILFIYHTPRVKTDYPFNWIPEHKNTFYDYKTFLIFRKFGVSMGNKIQVFNCF
jgi:hypothetical protein